MATSELEQRLLAARDGQKHFAYIARQVTEAQAAEALGLGIAGLFTIEEPTRIKPSGSLVGASVLGSTDIDNVGQSGLEKQYDAILSGKNGKLIVEEGTKGRTIPGGVRTGAAAVSGSTLALSIDRVLQFEVDQLLAQAVAKTGAKNGIAIVSRVGTSEILANSVIHREEGQAAEPTTENRAVTWGFEPGSVMKAITISALIDSGTVDVDSQFEVPIIQQSSNVGTIMMTQQLGEAKLHEYLTRFGLGAPTGLGFPGESAGYVGNYGRWDGTTLSSYAIGQSIIVTPMQMLMALNTIGNHGKYVAPRYVLGRQTTDGKFIPEPAPDERQVISEESAAKVTQVLESVVTGGTGVPAQLSGFAVAGKTGTAWEPQNPHWIDDHYRDAQGFRHLTSSFMGFLPAEDPQLSVMVILDD
ncbi:MAG: penicillin-binding protein 2, partial [Actinobacteria bacterium]